MSKTPIISAPIPLDQPIERGEEKITSVQIRKPAAGELRGLKIIDIAQGDVDANLDLLPRITLPPLTAHEIGEMDAADMVVLINTAANFLRQRGASTDSPQA